MIFMITSNINGRNIPIKKALIGRLDKKVRFNYMGFSKTQSRKWICRRIKSKGLEKIYHINPDYKKAEVVTLISK